LGRPEEKRLLRTPRLRCEDNIKMDLQEVEWGGIDSMDLAQDRDMVGFYQWGNEPLNSIKCGVFLD
jgi:hypothetical protein